MTDNIKIILARLILCVILVVIGLFLGRFSSKTNTLSLQTKAKSKIIRQGEHKYINQLLECDLGEDSFSELQPFQNKLGNFISLYKKQNPAVSALSVYFRDLNNGPWFGINEQDQFAPASLLKTPLMIAYLKLSETDPGVLTKNIIYTGKENFPVVSQTIPVKAELETGHSYTVEDLIRRMITYSDNRAYYLLFKNINLKDLFNIYDDFGLSLELDGNSESVVTVKNYSSFFSYIV